MLDGTLTYAAAGRLFTVFVAEGASAASLQAQRLLGRSQSMPMATHTARLVATSSLILVLARASSCLSLLPPAK
jgi:hypothetical protein